MLATSPKDRASPEEFITEPRKIHQSFPNFDPATDPLPHLGAFHSV